MPWSLGRESAGLWTSKESGTNQQETTGDEWNKKVVSLCETMKIDLT
jgi:hypothetical protein